MASIISLIISTLLIKNLGLGKTTKNKILCQYNAFLIAYSICNIYIIYCVTALLEAAGNEDEDEVIDDWYIILLQALFYSQGFILPLLRILEPSSFKIHMQLYKNLFTCKHL